MKKSKGVLMQEAMDWCDTEDKSTEFMIQYMQDYARVNFDEVMNFLQKKATKQ